MSSCEEKGRDTTPHKGAPKTSRYKYLYYRKVNLYYSGEVTVVRTALQPIAFSG